MAEHNLSRKSANELSFVMLACPASSEEQAIARVGDSPRPQAYTSGGKHAVKHQCEKSFWCKPLVRAEPERRAGMARITNNSTKYTQSVKT